MFECHINATLAILFAIGNDRVEIIFNHGIAVLIHGVLAREAVFGAVHHLPLVAALIVKSSALLKATILMNKCLQVVGFTRLGHCVVQIVLYSIIPSFLRVGSRDVPLVSATSARAAPFVEFGGHTSSIVWTLRL